MKITKNYSKLLLVCGLFVSISGCKKDAETPLNNIEINLPGTVSLRYGEQHDITLPENILSASDVKITLELNETENVQINSSGNLHDKLVQAIVIDKAAKNIHINSSLLYPNGTVSSVTGKKLPDSYKVAVVASSASQGFQGKQTIEIKVTAAGLDIKGLDNTISIPVAYVLYGNAASYELEAPASILAGTSWDIENKSILGTDISLNANQLKFPATAGDPDKKTEKAYDVIPVLKKDGFTVASRVFRVFIIPQIKFFFGTYYSDLDLTIFLDNLHIALSNGYISSAPTLYPEKYKSSFVIRSVDKDGKPFDNTEGVFAIDAKTGSVTVKKNLTLTEGAYKITVKAITTTGLEFLTTLTLNMSKAE